MRRLSVYASGSWLNLGKLSKSKILLFSLIELSGEMFRISTVASANEQEFFLDSLSKGSANRVPNDASCRRPGAPLDFSTLNIILLCSNPKTYFLFAILPNGGEEFNRKLSKRNYQGTH